MNYLITTLSLSSSSFTFFDLKVQSVALQSTIKIKKMLFILYCAH